MVDMSLAGKTALVTGASRGLGRAVAQMLAAQGALVAINYANNDEAARETLAAIESDGGSAFLLKGEQGSYTAAKELADKLIEELQTRTGHSALDILVNNAGGGPHLSIADTTPELYDKILADNLSGPWHITRLLMPHMRSGGRVIFTSSLGARTALTDYAVYSFSKAAVEKLTVIMAKELGPRNITVNCVAPGLIESDANAHVRADEQVKTYLEQTTPLRRLGVPQDLAGAVLALVSDQMSYVTGQIIEVSGGMSL